MRDIADGVAQLTSRLPNAFNAYLVEDVLIDGGPRAAARRWVKQLRGRELKAHAVTHAHPDHTGASRAICDEFGVPFMCPAREAEAAERGDWAALMPPTWQSRAAIRAFAGPPCLVSERLSEGDRVAGFEVLDTPGHSPGHVVYFREPDRVLIAGDAIDNIHVVTGVPGLHLHPGFWTFDRDQMLSSLRRLATLEPALVLFGHGAPLRDTRKFVSFIERATSRADR